MSFILQHPYTTPTLTVTLSNPILSNARRADDTLVRYRSRNGTPYSYVNRGYEYALEYDFLVDTRALHDSIIAFLRTAGADEFKVTDHNAQVWKVRNLEEISDFIEIGTAQGACDEATETSLHLRGLKI
jgi:hypothetical protein